MKIRTIVGLVALISLGGCGGGGSSSSDTSSSSGSSGGSGTASVSSLSSVPSVDISNIDYTTSTSTASKLTVDALSLKEADAGGVNHGAGDKKGFGQNFNAVGNPSRAGCEQNMHKKEIRRHSKESAIDFCYAKAMETAKLIPTLAADSTLYLSVVPPKDLGDNKGKACDGIPKDHTEEIANCKAGGANEGPGASGFKIKYSDVGGKTRTMDMCEGKTLALVSESSFTADGSKYTIKTARIGQFNGHTDKNSFDATIDLGTTGKVTDGIPDLGDGTATATAVMDGGFGAGTITFAATGGTKAVTLSGVFNGKFKEQRTGLNTSFTGKVYSQGDASTGCAKFSFTGAPPPMPLKDMIPFNISDDQLDNFLQNFGMQMGIAITKDNYKTMNMCPNPDFDPENPDTSGAKKPMVVAGATGCASVTHTGVECFSVTNTTKTGSFGQTETKQVFTIIANSGSPFYTAVNAFDLSTLTASTGSIAFTRNWDCTAEAGKSFTELDFSKFTQEQATAAQTAMKTCFSLEDEIRGDNGMGDHNCNEQQQQGDMNRGAKNGPPPQGPRAGQYKKGTITCTPTTQYTGRDVYFINTNNPDTGEYCLGTQGGCSKFTATTNDVTGLNLSDPDGSKVTEIHFTQTGTSPATAATFNLTVNGSACTVVTTNSPPKSFDKPPDQNQTQANQTAQAGGPPPQGQPPSGQGGNPAATGKRGDGGFCPGPCHKPDGTCIAPDACQNLCAGNPDCNRRD